MRLLLSLAAGALVSGCAHQVSGGGTASPPSAGVCDASGARFAVGQVAAAPLLREAQQRAGAARVRVLRPGEVVTMEFDGTRLNLVVDSANRVEAVRCG